MKTGLHKRLQRLETAMAAVTDGIWNWAEKVAEVNRRAMQRMSPQDQLILTEHTNEGRSEVSKTHPAVWDRWTEAFDWACNEVRPPIVPTVWDGRW